MHSGKQGLKILIPVSTAITLFWGMTQSVWYKGTNISEKSATSIFRIEGFSNLKMEAACFSKTLIPIYQKKEVKFRGWGLLQHYSLWLIVLLTPKRVPSFISRGAAHQRRAATSASEGRNYRWTLANNPVTHVSC
jgi:hypothetical protein